MLIFLYSFGFYVISRIMSALGLEYFFWWIIESFNWNWMGGKMAQLGRQN